MIRNLFNQTLYIAASIALIPYLLHSAALTKRTDRLWHNGTIRFQFSQDVVTTKTPGYTPSELNMPWYNEIVEQKRRFPYLNDPNQYGVTLREAFDSATDAITEAHPGIKFEEVPDGTSKIGKRDSIVMVVRAKGNSVSGRKTVKTNPILNLDPKRSGHKATIIHEFLHVLGYAHQQSCLTRDDFVCYYPENDSALQKGKKSQYRLRDFSVWGQYDFDSIMQYADDRFIKKKPAYPKLILGKKKTVGSTDCSVDGIVYDSTKKNFKSFKAQRIGLSQIDTWSLRNAYFHSTKNERGADFNGDGFADMVIGIPQNDIGTGDNSAHVIYGNGYSVINSVVTPTLGEALGLDTEYQPYTGATKSAYNSPKVLHQDLIDTEGETESGDNWGNVITVGDFNGDFQQDIAIGAPGKNNGDGACHVIYSYKRGKFGPSRGPFTIQDKLRPASSRNIHDAMYLGKQASGEGFGSAIASSDFNGDGYSDLAVAAPNAKVGKHEEAGLVRIWLGSASGLNHSNTSNAIPHLQIISQNSDNKLTNADAQAGNHFGTSMTIGDFNHDGRGDLAIGAPDDDIFSKTDAGLVVVYYGQDSLKRPLGNPSPNLNESAIKGEIQNNGRWGSVLESGDFNGDGHSDLVIGNPNKDKGKIRDTGSVVILYGNDSGLSPSNKSQTLWQTEAETDDKFGQALHAADMNGDGITDLAVGCPGEEVGDTGTNLGSVEIYYGVLKTDQITGGLDQSNPEILSGNSVTNLDPNLGANAEFGFALSGGDFDNNGYVDLVIGAPGVTLSGKTNAGQIIVRRNDHKDSKTRYHTINRNSAGISASPETGDRFGSVLMQ